MNISYGERPVVAFKTLAPGDVFYDFRKAEYAMVIDNKCGNGVRLSNGFVQYYDPFETVFL